DVLHVPVVTVVIIFADTDLTPYEAGTFGSRTTPVMAAHLRKVAAAAREILLDLAAEQNQVDREQLLISAGKVKNRQTDQVYEFTKLTEGKQILQKVSDDVPTTAAQDWQITGTSVLKVDGHLFVTGKHKYTPDFKLPGMQIGKALRPPAFGAELKSLD